MTYFQFLLVFLCLPLAALLTLSLIDRRDGAHTGFPSRKAVWIAIGLHVLLALGYTTPWDNYLVATGVWFYAPKLISGILIGWVPVEEYIFFVLETVLTGLWWWFLVHGLQSSGEFKPNNPNRRAIVAILGIVWLLAMALLVSGWRPATYLSLILAWSMPPMILQSVFGADILWHYRKLVILTVLPVFLFISAADSMAIHSGTWTINPAQSLNFFIGALPVEEAIFFLVTAMMISFGMTLCVASAGQSRWRDWVERLSRVKRYRFKQGVLPKSGSGPG